MRNGTALTTWTEKLIVETCCSCGQRFAMEQSFRDERLADGKTFYCPAGHPQHYTRRQNDLDRLRKELARANGNEKWHRERADRERAERQAAERSAAAYKGHLTRARKRQAAGVCPVEGCRRHFANLAAHMATKHPA